MAEKRRHFRDLSQQVLSGVEESFDFVKFAENIGLPPFSVFNTLTGYPAVTGHIATAYVKTGRDVKPLYFWPSSGPV